MVHFKRETVFKIWYLRFILNYPTHFHHHVTPKLGFTLQNQYCVTGNVSAKMKTFCFGGRKKGPFGHPRF